MKTSLIPAIVLWAIAGETAVPQEAPNVFESSARPAPVGQLDRIVFARLSSLGVQPVLCSDAVFVRRAYLDVIGTLPTAKEAREFIEDPDTKSKRRLLIDRLLEIPFAIKQADADESDAQIAGRSGVVAGKNAEAPGGDGKGFVKPDLRSEIRHRILEQ